MATFAIASAQTRTVTGKVVSADDDEPLAGVSVLPVGGGMGTSTNEEGDFTIKVNANVKKLRFTYVGMHTLEVEITDAPLMVKMVSTDNTLDEVMVVAYGTAKKSAYTGAASVVDASVIEDRLVSNVTNALSGVVAGVQTLSSNGQPGTSSTVRIRGVGSINASMNPLYVLDGIPYDGDISSINPSDIDQMTVLKDAAAAALYGARGANGVILITTKSGKQGKTNVTLDMKWGANSRQVTNYDVISSPAEYMELTYAAQRNAAIYNLGYTPSAAHAYGNSQLFKAIGYRVFTTPDGEDLIMPNGKINPNATLGYSNGVNYFTPDDWADVSFRNGLRQEYNVGISGASEKFNYYLSANYLEDEGVIDNSSFNRISTRLNVDYNVTKWLKVGANISYAYSKSQYPDEQTSTASSGNAFMIANTIAPVYPIYVRNADGTIAFNKEYGHNIYDYGDGKSTAYSRQFFPMANPAGQLVYDRERYLTDLFNGKWYAQLNPVKGLTITGTVGTTIDNTRYNMVSNPLYGQFAEMGGQSLQQSERISALNLQGLINYNKTFNELHTIDILLGYESYEQHDEYVYAIGSGLYNPTNWTVNNTLANNQRKGYGSYGEYATRGFFGRVNYDYNETYFGSVSYRRDASSRFHPDNRWGNFWSISAAWNIANESFLKDQTSWLNQLKLRASFGQQGNDGIGNNYAYLDQYQITGEDNWSDGKLVYKGNK
ncbi:MAG: SusC/RagA family TonB-linked outer membrane protein, partial [Paramuribaculum sp.]|nr:SusC/RagA family TonB-linked outer membrane protein [Paramuribaculum sp.]